MQTLIAAGVVFTECCELPFLASDPREDPGLEGTVVGADQLIVRSCTQCRARQLADDFDWISVAR